MHASLYLIFTDFLNVVGAFFCLAERNRKSLGPQFVTIDSEARRCRSIAQAHVVLVEDVIKNTYNLKDKSYSEQIKRIRADLLVTQTELAEMLGATFATANSRRAKTYRGQNR